jgi:hypothetical protein
MRPGTMALALPWVGALCMCGGERATPPPASATAATATAAPAPAPPPASAPTAAAAGDAWTCGGDLVPPTGWQQETAFADNATPNARETASKNASDALRDRLCQHAGSCDFLAAHIRTWRTGSNAKETCAMAVISSSDLDEWRKLGLTLSTLDDRLASAAAELLKPLARSAHKAVAIDRIVDAGVPGGQRAEWLRTRMEHALQSGATLTAVPTGWAGDGVPPGIDLVVQAEVFSRSENGIASLEVEWIAIPRSGGRVRSTPVTFPESAAPHAPASPPPPTLPESEGVSLRLDSGRGGSLCAGERTQLWLESDAAASVRVFDLFGDGDAILMFPNEDQPNASVGPRQTVALGGKLGFEAVPAPGSEYERFLVVAAPNDRALGPFAKLRGTCRVPAAVARDLHRGVGLPTGAKSAWTGYRIVTGASCPPPPENRTGTAQSLASLPECR